MPDPWNKVEEKYPVGKVVSGEVTSIHPFGFFVRLEPGVEGLVPRSEVFWGNSRKNLEDVVKVGDLVKVEVINVDRENRKLTLSYRKARRIHGRTSKTDTTLETRWQEGSFPS